MIDAGIAVRGEAGRWMTPAGSLISAGAGYRGRDRDGVAAAPGKAWAFYTGDIAAWRDPVFQMETFGHVGDGTQDNAHVVIVERQYVLAPGGESWFGALVDLT